jgi:dTDP-L-rhamnose 4-epimerase
VLVTGGAGFIGSHIVDRLLAEGARVRVLDVLHPDAHTGKPDYLDPRAEYVFSDLRDREVVETSLAGVDGVCHQASMVGLGKDFQDVTAYVSHNGVGTATLLAAMARVGFSGRLILASSMTVYGEGRYSCPKHGIVRPLARGAARLAAGRFDQSCPRCDRLLRPEPIPEDAPLEPGSVYAATKIHQEHLCRAYARERGAALTVLRYHNVYGPRMPRDTPYAGVASVFRSALEAGQEPEVFEDGRQLRDFVHVSDVARANVLALTSDPPATGEFNVASGEPHTIADMAGALADAFGREAPRPRVTGAFRLGDVRHVIGSPTRASTVLDFRASTGFAEGMRDFARSALRPNIDGPVRRLARPAQLR